MFYIRTVAQKFSTEKRSYKMQAVFSDGLGFKTTTRVAQLQSIQYFLIARHFAERWLNYFKHLTILTPYDLVYGLLIDMNEKTLATLDDKSRKHKE